MGWLTGKIQNWALGVQEKEMRDFITKLSYIDASEIGLPVALATNYRHFFREETGLEFLQPSLVLLSQPTIATSLLAQVQSFQKAHQLPLAAAVMVWLHSIRAMSHIELRPPGRQLWQELSRGFPHVEAATLHHRALTGARLNIKGFDQIPDGLGPQVR